MKNTQTKGVVTGAVIMFIALITSTIPYIFSWDMMRWGYGTLCITGFLFITGLIIFLMYLNRYFKLESILKGDDLIVHWTYSKDNYLKEAEKSFIGNKEQNKFLLLVVWFFFIVITVIFVGIFFLEGEEDSIGFFLLIMGGVLMIVTAFGIFMPYVIYQGSLKTESEAYISKKGLFYLGQLHTWNAPLFVLENLEISKDQKSLVFEIKYFTKLGWYKYEHYSVEVPIPEDKLSEAKIVVKNFNN